MRFSHLATGVVGVVMLSSAAQAVIVNGGDGTQNTFSSAAPAAIPANFQNISRNYDASSVYLGNGWVMTATHIEPFGRNGAGDLTNPFLGPLMAARDINHNIIPGIRLTTNTPGDADIALFRLESIPALPGVTIGTATPVANVDTVTMVGFGRNRDASPSTFNVANPGDPAVNVGGYLYGPGQSFRSGTNLLEADSDPFDPGTQATFTRNFINGPVTVFGTVFDNVTDQAQVATGDSGGAVFNSSGELVGMLIAAAAFTNQPADSVAYGNYSFAVDLAQYRTQIQAIVATPEPSSLGLLGLAALGLLRRSRR